MAHPERVIEEFIHHIPGAVLPPIISILLKVNCVFIAEMPVL
jgi:hypothetical protein